MRPNPCHLPIPTCHKKDLPDSAPFLQLFEAAGETNDDVIYEKSRRLVGAQMQNVVYGQYLHAVLGDALMSGSGLALDAAGSTYDASVNPGIRDGDGAAGFHTGH